MTHEITLQTMPSSEVDGIAVGDWYWVKDVATRDDPESGAKPGDKYEWLGCVWHVGTNYVELRSPRGGEHGSYRSVRIHFVDVQTELRREADAATIIRTKANYHRMRVSQLIDDVRAISRRLGFRQAAIGAPEPSTSTALAVLSSSPDVSQYKKALAVAKDKELPELFKEIKNETHELNRWMMAGTMPLSARARTLKGVVAEVEERIFHVSLYAGLTEDLVTVRKGKRAPPDAKVHVMQRRLYMDEECLLNYTAGGMEFSDIGEFDRWLAEPVNMDRVLPFARTVVAFRVRRSVKERDNGGDLMTAYINVQLGELDKLTFLYIRNGERLQRLSCDHDFGEALFPPDVEQVAMMMNKEWGRVEELITRDDYEVRVARKKETAALHAAWKKANPKKDSFYSPHDDRGRFNPGDWEPFDPSSVYYDDANELLASRVNSYNRFVLVLQGLLDRSQALHPHPPINLWRAKDMDEYVELVRDGDGLASGEKPDFEAYRAELNARVTISSYLTGQDDLWQLLEAEKEKKRAIARYGYRDRYYSKRLKPYGDPGPGLVSRPSVVLRGGVAVFSWSTEGEWNSAPKARRLRVETGRLLNVSAYRPGDYKMFFADHRTRQEYLQWAPLMLAAEDWHAARRKK